MILNRFVAGVGSRDNLNSEKLQIKRYMNRMAVTARINSLKKKQLSSPNTGETKSMFISLFLEKLDIFVD